MTVALIDCLPAAQIRRGTRYAAHPGETHQMAHGHTVAVLIQWTPWRPAGSHVARYATTMDALSAICNACVRAR